MFPRWALFLLAVSLPAQSPFDLVIENGHVLDPESKLDAVRNIGITNGRIAAISAQPLMGKTRLDAKGLTVTPGFIDLHWHGLDPAFYRYPAMQGVTSALELEIGVADVDTWYADHAGKSLINYGAASGHAKIRMDLMHDPGSFLPSGDAANRAATEEEISQMTARLERDLQRGAPAVGFGIAYTPLASYHEIMEMFRVAARFNAPCHVHMRSGEPGLSEVIAAAFVTGAPLHIVHLNSSAGSSIRYFLSVIERAKERGLDITTEVYPYTASATRIESALFSDWQTRSESYFQTVQWVATGERLTKDTFARYRKQGGRVIVHGNTEENVRLAITSPITMIASDGSDLPNGQGHPRSSGTFARVLGRYVREQKALTVMEAVRKMTIMPAERLEKRVPAMRNKGRIRMGADADIAIFDPARVIDKSDYMHPAEYSEGVVHVLVGGVPVVRDGALVKGANPGKPLRAN